jgi:hypothetical protein
LISQGVKTGKAFYGETPVIAATSTPSDFIQKESSESLLGMLSTLELRNLIP